MKKCIRNDCQFWSPTLEDCMIRVGLQESNSNNLASKLMLEYLNNQNLDFVYPDYDYSDVELPDPSIEPLPECEENYESDLPFLNRQRKDDLFKSYGISAGWKAIYGKDFIISNPPEILRSLNESKNLPTNLPTITWEQYLAIYYDVRPEHLEYIRCLGQSAFKICPLLGKCASCGNTTDVLKMVGTINAPPFSMFGFDCKLAISTISRKTPGNTPIYSFGGQPLGDKELTMASTLGVLHESGHGGFALNNKAYVTVESYGDGCELYISDSLSGPWKKDTLGCTSKIGNTFVVRHNRRIFIGYGDINLAGSCKLFEYDKDTDSFVQILDVPASAMFNGIVTFSDEPFGPFIACFAHYDKSVIVDQNGTIIAQYNTWGAIFANYLTGMWYSLGCNNTWGYGNIGSYSPPTLTGEYMIDRDTYAAIHPHSGLLVATEITNDSIKVWEFNGSTRTLLTEVFGYGKWAGMNTVVYREDINFIDTKINSKQEQWLSDYESAYLATEDEPAFFFFGAGKSTNDPEDFGPGGIFCLGDYTLNSPDPEYHF